MTVLLLNWKTTTSRKKYDQYIQGGPIKSVPKAIYVYNVINNFYAMRTYSLHNDRML